MVISGRGDGHAQKIGMSINACNQTCQKDEEAEVLSGVVSRFKKIVAVGGKRPVIMFARTVNVVKGSFVLKAGKTVVWCQELEFLHS